MQATETAAEAVGLGAAAPAAVLRAMGFLAMSRKRQMRPFKPEMQQRSLRPKQPHHQE